MASFQKLVSANSRMVRRKQSAESEASTMIKILVPRTGRRLDGVRAIANHFGYLDIHQLRSHLNCGVLWDYNHEPPCLERVNDIIVSSEVRGRKGKPVKNSNGETFDSLTIAANHYKVVPSTIYYAIKRRTKSQGMYWEYLP